MRSSRAGLKLVFLAVVALALAAAPAAFAKGSGSHSSSHSSSSHSSKSTTHSSKASHHTTATKHSSSTAQHASKAVPGVARDSHGNIKRSTKAKDDFQHSHPCPSTGKSSGACPGYVIDHVKPLKRGGADAPSNMQWQTVEAAKAKDKVE